MEKIIENTLKQLDLSPNEIKFFMTCFKTGTSTVNEIAKLAKIKRSSAYIIAESLLEKKFLQEDFSQYKKRVTASESSSLLRMLSAKQRTIGRQEIELKEHLAEVQVLYGASEIRPRIKVYDGVNGLVQIKEDILSSKTEIFLWTNQEAESSFFSKNHHDKFIEIRKKRGIKIKVLAVRNNEGEKLQAKDEEDLRETRLLPANMEFTSETYIYDNKIAILDFKKDIFGAIIESEQFSLAQKTIFNINWNALV